MFAQLKNLILSAFLLFSFSMSAQSSQEISEKDAVTQVIKNLFDAMRASDTALLRSTFDPQMRLMTTYIDKEGKPKLHTGSVDEFVSSIGRAHDEIYDEKIWNYSVQIDGLLATVWTNYTFYVGEKMSHCGVNAFQLFNSVEGWKIIQITDTRNKEGCQTTKNEHKEALDHKKLIEAVD